MFTSSETPSLQRFKRPKTYGKQSRPISRNLDDDFVEGQDFVFAQKNAPKRTYSANSPRQGNAPQIAEKAVSPLASPRIHKGHGAPGQVARTASTPVGKISPRNSSLSSSVKTFSAKPVIEPSIFDPPSSDDEPQHFQILPTRAKKTSGAKVAKTTSVSEYVQKQIKDNKVTGSISRPKIVHSKTEVTAPSKKETDIFDIHSSGEEGRTRTSELKRKRLPLNRAATVAVTSPKRAQGAETPQMTLPPLPTPPQAKRPRLSASPSQNSPRTAPSSPRLVRSPSTPRRTPQRPKASPPRLVQSGVSAPAVLSAMVEKAEESPICDAMDVAVEYFPQTRRRHSSASDRSITPVANVATPGSGRGAATTPRQEKLWDALLLNDPPTPTESSLPTLTAVSATNDAQLGRPAPTRRRLADALKSAAEPSSDAAPSDDPEDDEVLDAEDDMRLPSTKPSHSHSQPVEALGGRPRMTYASQRSFLAVAEDMIEDFSQPLDDFAIPDLPAVPGLSQSRSNVASAQVSDDEDDSSKAMRSVHELRAAGGSRRFEDEIPLADLEGSGKVATSRRRTALLEICKKLLNDGEFLKRFCSGNLISSVVQRCKAEKDTVTNIVLAAVIALVLHKSKAGPVVSQLYSTGISDNLLRCLDVKNSLVSIAKERASNMSKVAQSTVSSLQNDLDSSAVATALWEPYKLPVVQPKLLALKALESLIRRLREAGNHDNLLTMDVLVKVLAILKESSTSLKDIKDEGTANITQDVQRGLCLSLLESFTLGTTDTSIWSEMTLSGLVSALETLLARPDLPESDQQLILRICINLANNNASISASFARPQLLTTIVSMITNSFTEIGRLPVLEGLLLFDRLILCLGAMINLAEWSDAVRVTVLTNDPGGIDNMVKIFVASRAKAEEADSMEDTQINVAYGYLAILLGNLCQNAEVKLYVKERLPGKNLQTLIEAVEEFVLVQQRTDMLGAEGGEDGMDVQAESTGAWKAFTERLRAVAKALRNAE